MKRVKFSSTKNEVSEMCLGTMYFGSKVDKKTSYELLDYYIDNNGNFIDTSNNYAFWIDGCTGDESETLLGEWIRERKNREDIFLATKVGVRPLNKNGDFEGLSKDTILKSLDYSLKRLKTDYIDLLYTHVDWRNEPLEETLEALNILIDSGKVKKYCCQ